QGVQPLLTERHIAPRARDVGIVGIQRPPAGTVLPAVPATGHRPGDPRVASGAVPAAGSHHAGRPHVRIGGSAITFAARSVGSAWRLGRDRGDKQDRGQCEGADGGACGRSLHHRHKNLLSHVERASMGPSRFAPPRHGNPTDITAGPEASIITAECGAPAPTSFTVPVASPACRPWPTLSINRPRPLELHPAMASALFSPIRLAGTELANRIVVSPMCQYSANDGCANDWHLTHLGMLANSGAGLLVVEATHVERHGRITHGCLGLYSDACEAALARVVDHCRRIGTARLGIQIAHSGRKGSARRPWEGGQALPAGEDPWETVAPSALPFGPDWHTPRAMTADDMARVRQAFASAAQRAMRIGFDAVELHMAHGYLIHSFMSPLSNTRNDEYGGPREARMRFPLDVARAVREVVPRGVALGARITGSDW